MADDYIRREDVNGWMEHMIKLYGDMSGIRLGAIKNDLDAIPAADVAPVVRCKDCAWWKRLNPYDGHGAEPCKRTCGYYSKNTDGEDFCSYGADMREDNE